MEGGSSLEREGHQAHRHQHDAAASLYSPVLIPSTDIMDPLAGPVRI